ncbi:MAG: type II toxin-antitoxin system VapC family toxin [Actinomycetota bacterium]
MRCVDVNVLVYAHRPEADRHEEYHSWLDAARRSDEPLGIVDHVLCGFLRIVTNPRVFRDPTPLGSAIRFADAIRASPASISVAPQERHWSLFTDLCRSVEARGNLVPGAYLAALAIESGGTWITADRGFARFPGLHWAHPLDG